MRFYNYREEIIFYFFWFSFLFAFCNCGIFYKWIHMNGKKKLDFNEDEIIVPKETVRKMIAFYKDSDKAIYQDQVEPLCRKIRDILKQDPDKKIKTSSKEKIKNSKAPVTLWDLQNMYKLRKINDEYVEEAFQRHRLHGFDCYIPWEDKTVEGERSSGEYSKYSSGVSSDNSAKLKTQITKLYIANKSQKLRDATQLYYIFLGDGYTSTLWLVEIVTYDAATNTLKYAMSLGEAFDVDELRAQYKKQQLEVMKRKEEKQAKSFTISNTIKRIPTFKTSEKESRTEKPDKIAKTMKQTFKSLERKLSFNKDAKSDERRGKLVEEREKRAKEEEKREKREKKDAKQEERAKCEKRNDETKGGKQGENEAKLGNKRYSFLRGKAEDEEARQAKDEPEQRVHTKNEGEREKPEEKEAKLGNNQYSLLRGEDRDEEVEQKKDEPGEREQTTNNEKERKQAKKGNTEKQSKKTTYKETL